VGATSKGVIRANAVVFLCENPCEKTLPKSAKMEKIGKNLLNGNLAISTTC